MPATRPPERQTLPGADKGRLSFLLEASTALAGASGYADALQRLARAAVPQLADLCLIDVTDDSGELKRMAAAHADPALAPLVAQLAELYPPQAGGRHPSADAMASGQPSWSPTMSDSYLRATTRDDRHFELVKQLGFSSYMCVPLVADGEILGSITLVSAGSGRSFGAADLELPEELAARVATVVAAARRHDRDHEIASELQRHLLPGRLPEVPGVEVAVRYLTGATWASAGGDFYDVVVLPSGRLGLVIGDVEGHDVAAAAVMGQLRSATRALAGQFREPAALVDALRWSWDLLGFERGATGVFARLDPASGDLVAASAGHPRPLLVPGTGAVSVLPLDPAPLLGSPGGPAVDYRSRLDPGQTLVLYTDGLLETRGHSLAESEQRLLEVAASVSGRAVGQICDGLLAGMLGDGERHDDVALLAVRMTG